MDAGIGCRDEHEGGTGGGPLELRHLRVRVTQMRSQRAGAIPSLPLELRSLCKGAWHRYASGGAVPLLPHEMRRCELK